jgi:hypothetical protein
MAIADRLQQVLEEMQSWSANPTQAFDDAAEAFYRETGIIAPGKSVPLEMGAMWTDEERKQRYEAWHHNRRVDRHNTVREAVAELRRRRA